LSLDSVYIGQPAAGAQAPAAGFGVLNEVDSLVRRGRQNSASAELLSGVVDRIAAVLPMRSHLAPPMIDAVDETYAETPFGHVRKGFVMAARSIRIVVARFVVVTGLAASLLAGSSALVEPTHASAAPMTCEDLTQWFNLYRSHAVLYYTLYVGTGNAYYLQRSGYYWGRADQLWATDCV
jgi:hypothetical protein